MCRAQYAAYEVTFSTCWSKVCQKKKKLVGASWNFFGGCDSLFVFGLLLIISFAYSHKQNATCIWGIKICWQISSLFM
jgi:sulfur transfer protein SufE